MAYDLLIKNGRVVDGSGAPSFNGDVAVTNGKIVGVGKFNETATRTINAEGRVVAPGFIDHHTHFDPQCMWDPIVNSTSLNGNTLDHSGSVRDYHSPYPTRRRGLVLRIVREDGRRPSERPAERGGFFLGIDFRVP